MLLYFQFLKKHDELFEFNPAANWVSLKSREKMAASLSHGKKETFSDDAGKKEDGTSDGAGSSTDSKADCDKNVQKCTLTEKRQRYDYFKH